MKKLQIIFTFLSILLATLLFFQWYSIHNSYIPNTNQLDSNDKVKQFLEKSFTTSNKNIHTVPIGVFLESLNFITANDVEVSGYIWQKIDITTQQTPQKLVFIDAIGTVTLEKRYMKTYKDYELHGWYFEATLRQPFEYSNYPMDHKTVWIKIKPVGFNFTHILIPDLETYETTGANDTFGVSKDIVLLGWKINESFFDYMPVDYDNSFGLKSTEKHMHMPILSFNIVLNRNFVNAFMINITLLLSTMLLLYILVLMITSNNTLKEEFNISVGTAVATCGGLFFSVLLAHIHLREQFPSTGFVYIEFFYILNYLFITLCAFIIFSFYNRESSSKSIILKNDALFVKLIYWPLYFGIANIYTFLHF